VNDAAGAVTVAYVHPNEVTTSWHQSLLSLIGWDLGHECRVARGGWLAMRCYGADGIPAARNKAVRQFLATDVEWLFWIDTDMGFEPDTIDRLLEVADPTDYPIVAGLCFAQKQTMPDTMGGWRTALAPTIYDWTTIEETGETGFLSRREYPINTLLRCAGTGSACILIHRSVLEKVAASDNGNWYDRIPNPTANNRLLGEDLSFCLRAGSLDIPIHVHTGVRTTHFKPEWLGEEDYWASVVPPPATESTAVIVPVLRRPQNAAPFMATLRATTGLATVYAVANIDDVDTVKAWEAAGATVLFADGISFASKVNAGHAQTTEPWLFIVGDDVRFHPGWLDHAQAAAVGHDVVGTNDLGNPRVMRGEHATHMLIRRAYVDEQGASWDNPGSVCHEGYRHWFVDDEIVTAARQRGAFAFAPASIVEHLHPSWGKGAQDDVYELGQSAAEQDRETFEARCATYL
jgi:hypothetical protein